jgi:dipeptide/tripeptide permease
MERIMSEASPASILRSVGAVLAGVVTVIVLSLGTDVILHASGVYPPWFQPMADPLWVLALAYRIVYGVAGGYIAARFAPSQPMKHALIVGFIGLALTIVGVAMHWNKGPEFGPKWFNLGLVVTALPCAWAGGKLISARPRRLTA